MVQNSVETYGPFIDPVRINKDRRLRDKVAFVGHLMDSQNYYYGLYRGAYGPIYFLVKITP